MKKKEETCFIIKDELFPENVFIQVEEDGYVLGREIIKENTKYKPKPYGFFNELDRCLKKMIELKLIERLKGDTINLEQYLIEYKEIAESLTKVMEKCLELKSQTHN